MHFLIFIFIGACFGLEKRQSEYDDFNEAKRITRLKTLLSTLKLISAGERPIKEHLIPPLLTAETPEWKIEEEELPDLPEQRKLVWLEDEARFADFPLGTIRQIEKNAPTAVVVPAAEDTPLQVARNGPHVFVTNDEVIGSPLKFISHHHPSLRTVDLNELADDLNLIFAHPRHHQLPETVMVLPEDNPVVKVLSDLQRQQHQMEDWGSFGEGQERSAQLDLPTGVNASANPFGTTILVLPDDSPVKKYLKDLQDKMKEQQQKQNNQTAETQVQEQANQAQEEGSSEQRSATIQENQRVFIPTQQQFTPPTASFINLQPHQHTTFMNQPLFRTSQQENNGNPEQVGAFQEEQERTAQSDLPQGLNASAANPFATTILVLPDDSPVKKHLKELQDKMNMREQQQKQGNQTTETQTQQPINQNQEEDNSQERSATSQGVFVPLENHQGLFVPIQQQFAQSTSSFINHQPAHVQFPHQHTTFINRPFFRDSQQDHNGNSEQVSGFQKGQQRSAQFDIPQGLNASAANPFGTTVLILPDDNPVKKQLKELQDKMNMREQQQKLDNQSIETQTLQPVDQTQEEDTSEERSATPHGKQGLFIPTRYQFLQPATSFVNHQPVHVHSLTPGFAQFPDQQNTFNNQPLLRDTEKEISSEEARAAKPTHHWHKYKLHQEKFGPKVIPQNIIHIHQQQSAQSYQNPGYQRVAAPFLIDVPARRAEFREERSKRSPTLSRPGSVVFQQQRPSLINQPFLVPQSSGFGQQSVFQQPSGFAVVPSNLFFRSGQQIEEPDPFLRSPEGDNKDFSATVQQNSSVANGSVDKPLTAEDIERIETTIPEVFPQPGGYFPIIQGTSPNGLPLEKPSDDPYYADLQKIRPVNITALEEDYFKFIRNKTETHAVKVPEKTFPLLLGSCDIPVVQAISPDGAPLTKPSDDPFFICLNKTKARFSPSHQTIKECIGYETTICQTNEQTITEQTVLNPSESDENVSEARSEDIDLEETIGPLSIFEFSNQDNDDDISVVELEQVFPVEIRTAKADPTPHHHHGSHFFIHQHGFVPNQQCQESIMVPTQQSVHIPHLVTNINTGFGLVHQLDPSQSQSVQISGKGNGVSQSQTAVQTNSGTLLHGGQNVHISGEGNSVSQLQGQTASVLTQNSQIQGTGNTVVLSQDVHRNRRSLVELVNDPNVKLDVPKTISNIGTVTKTSFHDQKKPMYHLNNMVGSIKDVIMSTIKIPPQGLIIPSQYRIVNAAELDDNSLQAKHEITRSINRDLLPNGAEVHLVDHEQNGDPVTDTFNKFGSAIRQSIQAGQQTLAHVGDIAHSARQMVYTAKSAAPQVFLPLNKKTPDKVMLVTPKLLETKNAEEAGQPLLQAQNTKDFVKMGDLMDALSVSSPNEENPGVEKIVIERKSRKRKPVIVGRFKDVDEGNLKKFVSKMEGELGSLLKEKLKQESDARRLTKTMRKLERQSDKVKAPLVKLARQPSKLESVLGTVQDHVDIMKSKSNQVMETIQNVNGKFIDTIRTISGSKAAPKEDVVGVTHIVIPKNFLTTPKPTARLKSTNDVPEDWDKQVSSFLTELFKEKTPEEDEEVVGAPQFSKNSLNLRPDLMKPFMGRASQASLRRFLKQHGNKAAEAGDGEVVGAAQENNSSMNEMEMEKVRQAQKVLGAVNPLMFEKLFNETMSGSDGMSMSPYEVFTAGRNVTDDLQICHDPTKVGTSMKITRELLKPFMGRLKGNEYMKVIPVQNNGDEEEGYYMEE